MPYDQIKNIYYLKASAGSPQVIDVYEAKELRYIYGEGAAAPNGIPLKASIQGTNLQLFPAPDNQGPTGGNYTIVIEYLSALTNIVETTGVTVAASPTLTVKSTAYLTDRGLAAAGSNVSIRRSGNIMSAPGGVNVIDTFLTNWIAFPSATTVTLSANSPVTSGANEQVFFNSVNWLIQRFPKIPLFGVYREIAAYLDSESFQTWDARYEKELDLLSQWDSDSARVGEILAAAVYGQRRPELRDLDTSMSVDVRGA